jgi:hypothetical protein
MNAIWITSMILQWATIGVLSVLVLSLMRQLGERNAPETKGQDPDKIFEPFSELTEQAALLINGDEFRFGGPEATPTLIVFFSPKCGACEQLPEAILGLRRQLPSPEFRVLAVLKRSDMEGAKLFINEKSLQSVPVALEENFPELLNPGGAPFAAAIAKGGKVAARGRPKTLTHLREMAHAAENMAHMAPEHSRRSHEWGESVPYWVPEQIAASEHRPVPASA